MDVRIIKSGLECEGRLSRALFDLWFDLKRGRPVPLAGDFDFLVRPELVRHLIVLNKSASTAGLKVTYTGSEVTRLFGRDDMNRKMSDVLGHSADDKTWALYDANTQKILDLCFEKVGAVLNGPGRLSFTPEKFLRFESLTVPFVDAEGKIVQTLSIFDLFGVRIDLGKR